MLFLRALLIVVINDKGPKVDVINQSTYPLINMSKMDPHDDGDLHDQVGDGKEDEDQGRAKCCNPSIGDQIAGHQQGGADGQVGVEEVEHHGGQKLAEGADVLG